MSIKILDDEIFNLRPRSSYTKQINKAIKLLAYSPRNVIPFGSFVYQSQLFPSDIDLIEEIRMRGSATTIAKKVAKDLQKIVKKAVKQKGVYLGDVKAGLNEIFYNINLKPYNPARLKNEFDMLYKGGFLDKENHKILVGLLIPKPSIDQFEVLEETIRKLYIVRWDEKELIKGYKVLPGGIKLKLSDAIQQHTLTKIDLWVPINNKYVEVTNLYIIVRVDNKGKDHILNSEGDLPILEAIRTEAKKFYSRGNPNGLFYKPFKMAKRMFSIARMIGDKRSAQPLVKLFRSDIGMLNQIASEMDTLVNMLERVKNPPLETMMKQIDNFKTRLSGIVNVHIDIDKLDKIINTIIDKYNCNEKSCKKYTIKKLEEMEKYLKSIISPYTVEYLKQVQLYPPPPQFFPSKKGEGLATKIYQKLANVYRRNFCNNKARPLYENELHPLCANYEGPGTRIDLEDVRNYPPYNNIDNCARTHDIDYMEANKLPQDKKELKIREADEKVLRCFEKYPNEEPYYSLGKLGINTKVKVEDLIPSLVKKLAPAHFGRAK